MEESKVIMGVRVRNGTMDEGLEGASVLTVIESCASQGGGV